MNNNRCKKCGSDQFIKSGKIRSQQRYKFKICSCNFIIGDKREKLYPLAILLYGIGKASSGFIAKLFKVISVAVMKLIKRETDKMPDPEICSSIKEVSFDEMWHFVEQKNKLWVGVQWKSDNRLVCRGKHSEPFTNNLSI